MKLFKLFQRILLALVIIALACLLSYFLPSTRKVFVTGIQIKRVDTTKPDGQVETRDVRFILTKDFDSRDPLVFRNEDTRWGFPLYFKFDAADLDAKADDLAKSPEPKVALVTYYGTRNRVMDWYPNVLSMEVVDPGHNSLPWPTLITLGILAIIALVIYLQYRKAKRRVSGWFKKKPPQENP